MDTTGLRDWQRLHASQVHRALRTHGAALDASDTGTGKTFVACWLARELAMVPLVVCPKSVVPSWKRAADLLGIGVEVVSYEKVRGVRTKKLLRENVVCQETGKPFLGPFIARLSESEWGQEIKCGKGSRWQWKYNYELIIFDEVHRCGGMTSLSSKLLIAARRQAAHLLALSATAADDPRQLKALGFALRLFELRGFKWWLMKHGCEPGVWGGFEFNSDPAAMVKIHNAIFPARGSRMRKKEIPGFPATRLDVKLVPDETGRAARLAAALPETFGLAESVAVRQALELLRVDALEDLVLDYAQTSRVVVFLNYTRTIDALRDRLARTLDVPVPVIDGRNRPGERAQAVAQFQSNSIPVIVVNVQAGGTGLDLHDPTGQVDRTSLISPCWNAKDMMQVIGRVQRDGGAFSQQFFVYFADTHEAQIASAVSMKFTRLDALNDAVLNGVLPHDCKEACHN